MRQQDYQEVKGFESQRMLLANCTIKDLAGANNANREARVLA
jgi:hypothetical protein